MPGSMEERSIHRYHDSLERSQGSWRLSRLLNLDSISDYTLFATVWQFAHGPEQDLGHYFLRQWSLPHYIRRYHEVQQEDQPLSRIQKDEKEYFRNKDLRETIAKKLTIMSEWKTRFTVNNSPRLRKDMFVASPKLWKWIQQCVQAGLGRHVLTSLHQTSTLHQPLKRMRSTGRSIGASIRSSRGNFSSTKQRPIFIQK